MNPWAAKLMSDESARAHGGDEVQRLTAALRKYGQHTSPCLEHDCVAVWDPEARITRRIPGRGCTCGFDAALAASTPIAGQTSRASAKTEAEALRAALVRIMRAPWEFNEGVATLAEARAVARNAIACLEGT